MDITGISAFGFSLLFLVVCGVMLIILWATLRILWKAWNDESKKEEPKYETIFWSRKWRLLIVLCMLLATVYYTQVETAYRPKTTIGQVNPVLDEQLRKIDSAEPPVIEPAQGDINDNANSNYSEKNKEENAKAKEAFNK